MASPGCKRLVTRRTVPQAGIVGSQDPSLKPNPGAGARRLRA